MDTDDNQSDVLKPADEAPKNQDEAASPTASFAGHAFEYSIFAVPALGWCGLCTYWLWQAVPFYFALPAGCVLGTMLFWITSALIGGGVSTLQELGCGGIISLVLAVILTPVFPAAREKARRTTCKANVKAVSLALLMYAEDNDGRFPPASHWQAAAKTYLPPVQKKLGTKKTVTPVCPSVPAPSGYGYYKPLAGGNGSLLSAPARTPLLFDANGNAPDASATLEQLPAPGRHGTRNVVGFADGHVSWQKRAVTLAATPPTRKLYNIQEATGTRSKP